MAREITTLVDGRTFLEGPRWRGDALFASDMHAHEVIRVDAAGTVEVVVTLDGTPSGLGWLPDGRMLVVSMDDRRLLRLEPDGTLVEHAALASFSEFQINDMVVDVHGHAFVGQMGYDLHGSTPGGGGAGARPSALLRVDPDGSAHDAAPEMRVANGMAVANDDRTLLVAESAGKDLVAFDVAADGTLSNRRVWAELPDYPDGMCIDAEDGVWFACPVGDRFMRVVEGGAVTDEIPVPGRHAIACALGGADGRTLFMLTAPTLGNPEASREARGARIEITRVDVPGAERP
jgi:sugar lactone lactonase YvrE